MTVVATLVVRAWAAGFLPRLRHLRTRPVLTVDGVEQQLVWGRETALALAPGHHDVALHYRDRRATHGHAATVVELGPGGRHQLDAVLVGDRFTLTLTP